MKVVERLNQRRTRWAVIAFAAALTSAAFAIPAWSGHGAGFPLDDAWIHQTYARNLVRLGEWAFVPGEPSAGSTSPLWTLLQTVGHILGLAPPLWSALLGAVLLALMGVLVSDWWVLRTEGDSGIGALLGLLVVIEWHLVWAALSGMEILAFGTIVIATLRLLDDSQVSWIRVGALIGLGLWIRPDALSLLIPVTWVLLLRSGSRRRKLGAGLSLALGLAALAVPYLLLNLSLSGSFWPTTFYAKQTEYQILTNAPLPSRLAAQFTQPFVGVGAALLPGLALWLARELKTGSWTALAPLIWAVSFLTAYSVRLPVTYQHGRYAMPVIPIVLVLSYQGMVAWIRPGAARRMRRVLSRAWALAVAASAVAFAVLGARALATDVAIIQTEMVRTAEWIAANTDEEALVAGHDIGALGYFGGRRIIDLAGLVSPEVIPILRDEAALAAHLDQRGADYLMTFPSWYPMLVQRAELLFTTSGRPAPAAGGENMAVYRW